MSTPTPTTARGALLRRAGTLFAAAALVAAPAAAVLAPAAAAASTDPTLVGAHYLQQQLAAGGHHFSVTFDDVDYPDHGVTADAVLALAAAGTAQDEAALATQWLADDVVGYLGFGDPAEISAGATAKLLNVALAQGEDPTSFGGYDLLGALQGLEQPSGRFTDQSAYGDYSNTFGQSFALIGLDRAGETVSAPARAYLLAQQCPGGGFQLYMSDAGCTSDASADPDATAMAVQALIAVGGASAAADEGLDYLATRQDSTGGVGGGGPTSGVNANSTGLAGQAFLAGGRTAQARSAVSFLTSLQYGCDVPLALRGGIAYDAAAFAATQDAGASATPSDQDRRSTAQALLALAGTPLALVSAEGADAMAPALTCAAPSPTTTTTGSATPTSSATASPTATASATTSSSATPPPSASTSSATSGGSAPTGSDDPTGIDDSLASDGSGGSGTSGSGGSLAQTGGDLLLPVGIGLALVVVGGVVVAATRRRGAHS